MARNRGNDHAMSSLRKLWYEATLRPHWAAFTALYLPPTGLAACIAAHKRSERERRAKLGSHLHRRQGKEVADRRRGGVRLHFRHRPASRLGTNHTAGSPLPAEAMTRTPPGAGSTRKRQPCNSPGTVQPPGIACQGRCSAIQRSSPPRPSKAARAVRALSSVTPPPPSATWC